MDCHKKLFMLAVMTKILNQTKQCVTFSRCGNVCPPTVGQDHSITYNTNPQFVGTTFKPYCNHHEEWAAKNK